MKSIKLLVILLCFAANVFTQSPQINIIWSECYGGTEEDHLNSIDHTFDNGYILAGFTKSTNGDVKNGFGNEDPWILRLNSTGDTLWTKCFADENIGKANSIKETSDHGFIITGIYSDDLWVARLDISGNTMWKKHLGGGIMDEGLSIQETSDGGFIAVGMATSFDGDVHGCKGNGDCWVVRLSSQGDTLWTRCFGGTGIDFGCKVMQINDGRFIIIGSTDSNNGDIVNNLGDRDIWIICISATGDKLWTKCLGDTERDSGFDINTTADGNYIVMGQSESKDRIATVMLGKQDIYIAKLSPTGDVIWKKTYGGSSPDYGKSIQQLPDGGYIALGSTYSVDGDVSDAYNVTGNIWVLKISESGNIIWQKCFGGSQSESSASVHILSNSEFIIAGTAFSSDGDIKNQHGHSDFWMANISDSIQITNGVPDKLDPENIIVFPNPAHDYLTVRIKKNDHNEIFEILDVTGRIIVKKDIVSEESNIGIEDLNPGTYLYRLRRNNEILKIDKLIIK